MCEKCGSLLVRVKRSWWQSPSGIADGLFIYARVILVKEH